MAEGLSKDKILISKGVKVCNNGLNGNNGNGVGVGQKLEPGDEDFLIPAGDEFLRKVDQMKSLFPQQQKEDYEEESVLRCKVADLEKELLTLGKYKIFFSNC